MHHLVDRRTFVTDLGRGALAIAVLGVAACAPGRPGPSSSAGPARSPDEPPGPSGSNDGGAAWRRVDLGFVSAYIVARSGEAAIVDTGVAGSADAIEQALGAVGLGWAAVGQLILTHHHADHAGSAAAVMERAPDLVGHAGAEDIASIDVPRPLVAVADGDRVFGLEIVTAPGHTAGSICALDPAAGVLIAGDALRTDGGLPALPDPGFSADMAEALDSVAKLGALTFETLLVGHGDPLEGGASAAVAALAAAS